MSDDLIKRDDALEPCPSCGADNIEIHGWVRQERLTAATDDAKEAEAYAQELEAKLAKAVEVMKALQKDMVERSRAGMDTIHGNEYRIVNASRTAWIEFCATLAELEGTK